MRKNLIGSVLVVLWVAGMVSGQRNNPVKIPKFGKIAYFVTVKQKNGITERSEMIFQWSGKRFREERVLREGERRIITIGDGSKVYLYDPKTKTAAIQAGMSLETIFPSAPKALSLSKVGEEKVKGHLCDIYAGRLPGGRPGDARCWLTRKEGLRIQSETNGPYGKMIETLKVLDLRRAPPDILFRLPAGTRVSSAAHQKIYRISITG